MCGISGIHFFNTKKRNLADWQVEGIVNELLLGIEKRGEDSTGVATIRGNGDIWIEKAELKASEFIKHRTSLERKTKTILLHTRYATQGHQSNLLNNHPIDYNNAVIIHNGHINNDTELFHDEGLERNAEVDSEIIAALFDKHGIGKAHLALQKLSGGFAVAAIDQRNPTALVLAKGRTSPLIYYKNDNFIVWASERKVIIDAFKIYSDDGPDYKDLEESKEGEIIFIEHGKMETLEFQVKQPEKYISPMYNFNENKRKMLNNWDNWSDDKTDDEIRKEAIPRYGSYSIYPERGGEPIIYRCCFDCGVAANVELFTKFDGWYYCDVCLAKQKEWLSQDGEDISSLTDDELEDKILSKFEIQEHFDVCEKIGEGLGIPAGMVDYFLWECPELLDEKVKNEEIIKIYNILADLYDKEMESLDYEDVIEDAEVEETSVEIVKYKKNSFKTFLGL